MAGSSSSLPGSAIRVFALFTGLAFGAGMFATYVVQWVSGSRLGSVDGLSDVIKFGGPIAGVGVAVVVSRSLGWLAVHATAWQYPRAAVVAGVAMPTAFLVTIGLTVLVASALGRWVPSLTNDHPLYVAGAWAALAGGGAVFPLLMGYALRTLTGVWHWRLLGVMYAAMWLALLTPSPWDRPAVSVVGGLIGVWLSRSPGTG